MNKRGQVVLVVIIIGLLIAGGVATYFILKSSSGNGQSDSCDINKDGTIDAKEQASCGKNVTYKTPVNSTSCQGGFTFDKKTGNCAAQVKSASGCNGTFNKATGMCEVSATYNYTCVDGVLELVNGGYRCAVYVVENQTQNQSQQQIQTCSQHGGNICSVTQSCSTNWFANTSDTTRCCNGSCTSNLSQPVNVYEDSPFGIHPGVVDGSYSYALDMGVKWARAGIFAWTLIQPDITKSEYKFKHAEAKGGTGIQDYDAQYSTFSNDLYYLANFENDVPLENYAGERFFPSSGKSTLVSWTPKDPQKLTNFARRNKPTKLQRRVKPGD